MPQQTSARGEPVGVIGLGLLGSALAERLMAAGYQVVGFDVAPDCRDRFTALGGRVAADAATVAVECRRIVLSLPESSVSALVVSELQPALRAGDIIIDTTTGEPGEMEALAAELAAVGVAYLDASIAGSSEQVRKGEAVMLIGGEQSYEKCKDLLEQFSTQTFLCGKTGSGARMKLVVNLVLGLNRAVLAEGLVFAQSLGFQPGAALEVLRRSPATSAVMETKGQKMVDGDFTLQARLRQHLKDVRLILDAATRSNTPLSELHADLLQSLVDQGFGNEDNSAVIRAFYPSADRREIGH